MDTTSFRALTVREIRKETPYAVSIVFDLPESMADDFRFVPGQYLTVRRSFDGEEVRRSYSVCSGADDGELRIAVKRHDNGRFSVFANDVLRKGDTIEVMPPRGRFTAGGEARGKRTYLLVAAGSGITPILSILKTILARESDAETVLVYGNRDARSIMFKSELEDLKDRYLNRLTLLHVLTREHQDVGLLNGRIDADKIAAILRSLPQGLPDIAYLCGPTPMMKDVRETLERAGLAREQIRTEIFAAQGTGSPATARTSAAPAPSTERSADTAEARIILNGREIAVAVVPGETILEAAVRAGIDPPFSCKGGMCCTCRARLTEGEIDMAVNYSLEPWELEAGFVLTCQSRPTSRRVAIDYDAR